MTIWRPISDLGDLFKGQGDVLWSNGWLQWIKEVKIYRNGDVLYISITFFTVATYQNVSC